MIELLRRDRCIIADGGMGTELQAAGLPPGECGELWNVNKPDVVAGIHRRYAEAGAELILTNTFGASSLALARHGLAERASEINSAAAAVAMRGAGDDAWVFGDIGPFGGFLAPVGDTGPDELFASFHEQATALLYGMVDGIMIETMSDLGEVEIAVQAARAAGAQLVAASLSFEKGRGLHTMTGVTPHKAAERLIELGVDIIGTNCGTGMTAVDYCDVVRAYRDVTSTAPILVKLNAGTPQLLSGQTVYRRNAADFACALDALVMAGADIVGGCCGTGPEHIAALRSLA